MDVLRWSFQFLSIYIYITITDFNILHGSLKKISIKKSKVSKIISTYVNSQIIIKKLIFLKIFESTSGALEIKITRYINLTTGENDPFHIANLPHKKYVKTSWIYSTSITLLWENLNSNHFFFLSNALKWSSKLFYDKHKI